jgi:hypothetical protein
MGKVKSKMPTCPVCGLSMDIVTRGDESFDECPNGHRYPRQKSMLFWDGQAEMSLRYRRELGYVPKDCA